tara:strand:- start:38 stop:520 length:483 start_codon:yes stop_codon:yes gene_type:complete
MESVTVAFELMKLELEAAVEDLNTQGAELFRCSQYEEAKELTDHGGTLRHFCDRVDELATEWNNNFANVGGDEPTEQEQQAARTILSASKSSRTRLLVTFSDGTAIAEKTAAQTLVRVLERVGFERVAALGIYVNNENIVSETRSKKYGETEVAKYFIKT